MPRRKKGAQPGNTNALKHGFYSAQFLECEIVDLSTLDISDLQSEISAMRVWTRRMLQLADGTTNLDTIISVIYALSVSTSRVAMLAKSQQLLSGGTDAQITEAFNSALTTVMEELNIA